jgi:hypothetical protein
MERLVKTGLTRRAFLARAVATGALCVTGAGFIAALVVSGLARAAVRRVRAGAAV